MNQENPFNPQLSNKAKEHLLQGLELDCQTVQADMEDLTSLIHDPDAPWVKSQVPTVETLYHAFMDSAGLSDDVASRPWWFPGGTKAWIVNITGMASSSKVVEVLLNPLSREAKIIEETLIHQDGSTLTELLQSILPATQVTPTADLAEVSYGIASGQSGLFIEGVTIAYLIDTAGPKERPVGKTSVENVLRGPLDAFNENIDTSVALLRRRVHEPSFRIKILRVGTGTKTRVAVCSIGSRVKPEVLGQVELAISKIDVDAITDSGQLGQLMNPGWLHVFPLAISTERPDRAVMALFDGRVVVVVDTSPFVLILPSVYVDFFQAMEDLYVPWVPATGLRILRLVADHIAALAPALYVAVASFNPGILTPPFELVMASARALVPFSPLVEAILVLVLTDILIEAAIRSPKVVGNAVPIVGGIIIGDVLTKTHLASEVMLVAGALAAITQFTAAEPSISTVERLNKYWFLIWAGFLGFFGLMIATVLELAYMANLKSVGTPYFSPVAPFQWREALNAKLALPPRWRPRKVVE